MAEGDGGTTKSLRRSRSTNFPRTTNGKRGNSRRRKRRRLVERARVRKRGQSRTLGNCRRGIVLNDPEANLSVVSRLKSRQSTRFTKVGKLRREDGRRMPDRAEKVKDSIHHLSTCQCCRDSYPCSPKQRPNTPILHLVQVSLACSRLAASPHLRFLEH